MRSRPKKSNNNNNNNTNDDGGSGSIVIAMIAKLIRKITSMIVSIEIINT